MATHECSGCLRETIQGATEVDATLVLPNSICTAPGGRHTWTKKSPQAQGYLFIYFIPSYLFETAVALFQYYLKYYILIILFVVFVVSLCLAPPAPAPAPGNLGVISIAYFPYLYFICF